MSTVSGLHFYKHSSLNKIKLKRKKKTHLISALTLVLPSHPHDIKRTNAKGFMSAKGFRPSGMGRGTGPHQGPAGGAEPGPRALWPRRQPRVRLGGAGRAPHGSRAVLEPRQIALEGC